MNKLYRLYLALAAFVVMTTVFGLIVQRSVMSASDASAASSRFVSHKAAYDQLRLLGIRVQSAANEVFGNGEVEKQSTQVELAFAEFDRSMNREWADIILTEAGADAKLHLAALSDAETAMADVVREARLSFEALRHGHGNEAVARMARMNHAYDRIRKKMSDVDAVITSLRKKEFEHRVNHVDAMRRRYTYISAALIALSLIAVALYGNRMLREVLAIGELQRANAAFEDAIEGVAFVDKQKNYTYANRAFARRDGDIIR